ncbi:DsrE/DsrF/DrsH-like family protein [Candidatus Bathyarchaeota archaeon]|nr:DsrE/DsrF/DrsH-like family protein [Candidatus Bathyarchaeota archaeon]
MMWVKTMPKLSIIISSDKLDKLYPAAILASTAAAMDWRAELFFTFWGLFALKKGYEPKNVSGDYSQYEDAIIGSVESGSLPSWRSLMENAKKTGKVRMYACSTTLNTFGMKREDLEELVDEIVGAATFLSKARDADVTLFIS